MEVFQQKMVSLFLDAESNSAFFSSASDLLGDTIGYKLPTFTVLHPDKTRIRRIYASKEDVYPIGGDKPIPDNYWGELTIRKQTAFIGNNRREID